MKRVFDEKTMTYAYQDGSGRITHEQVVGRDLCKVAAEMAAEEIDGTFDSYLKAALLRLKYLTFYSK